MSVNQYDLRIYGSADMPDTVGTTGGAVTFTTKMFFSDVTSPVIPSVVSSSSGDTATTLAIYSLTSAGVLQNETVSLSGTTVVSGTLTAGRLMKGLAGGTTAAGDIAVLGNKIISNHTFQAGASAGATLQSGDGASVAPGYMIRCTNNTPAGVQFQIRSILSVSGDAVNVSRPWGTVPTSGSTYDCWTGMLFDESPNQITQVRRIFYGSYAQATGGASNTWYEKIFSVDDNTVTTLTNASIIKQIDPTGLYSGGGALNFALCNSLNDTSTITVNLNPGTGPTNISLFSSGAAPQTIAVSGGSLPSGSSPNISGAQGIWLQLILQPGEAPISSVPDMRTTGMTA